MTETTANLPNTPRVRLAMDAANLVSGQRQEDYGTPEENFRRISELWNAHLETDIITPRKVAELMLLLKVARTVNSPTEDSYVDMIGYAAIAGELAETEKENGGSPAPRYAELVTKGDLEALRAEIQSSVANAQSQAAYAQSIASQIANNR